MLGRVIRLLPLLLALTHANQECQGDYCSVRVDSLLQAKNTDYSTVRTEEASRAHSAPSSKPCDKLSRSLTANAWMYLADPPLGGWPNERRFNDTASFNDIPPEWAEINYNRVDTLVIGPLGIRSNGTFGLTGDEGKRGSLQTRFEHVVNAARASNPNLRIEASIWWQSDCMPTEWGRSLCALADPDHPTTLALAKDTNSVALFVAQVNEFLEKYNLDGFNIDYEESNVVPFFPELASALGDALHAVGRRFTISPASEAYLDESSLAHVDAVYMQTYAGGTFMEPSFFVGQIAMDKVFIGLCPESHCPGAPSPSEAMQLIQDFSLGGTHLWRLNSDNWKIENAQQATIHELVHKSDGNDCSMGYS